MTSSMPGPNETSGNRLRNVALSAAALVAIAAPAAALRPAQPEPLHASVLAPAGFVATVAPQELSTLGGAAPAALLAAVSEFSADHPGSWRYHVDRRSGGVALAEGSGIPWIPGTGNGLGAQLHRGSGRDGAYTAADLGALGRQFVERYPGFFALADASTLVVDPAETRTFGERNQYASVVFEQVIDHVVVEGARVIFRLSHGNLVQFGVDRTLPQTMLPPTSDPLVPAAAAKTALGTFLGGLLPGDSFVVDGELAWTLRGSGDLVGWAGGIGNGWMPHLTWKFVFRRAGQSGTWLALVDATNGAVLRFVDANDYASLVKASVYDLTNCAIPKNCIPGSAVERTVTMPFTDLAFVGGTCSGAGCYSNSAGAYDYPLGATSATTTLAGRYIQVVDACGATSASALAPGNIDLGTNPAGTPNNTDCVPATQESAPGSGPVAGGSGDTHSSRSLYYHLNLIAAKSRVYLPANTWIMGTDGDGSILTTANLPPACNAFWNGTSLNFMRVTPGLFCNNTGELPDVFLHEYGHGLDDNDLTGTAPESATGEAMGDTFALLQGQHSCIGLGFSLQNPTAPNWGNTAGYGSTRSALCTGVRDLDYTKYCFFVEANVNCVAPLDLDAPNGSRSGPNPGTWGTTDAGTPAKWSTMVGANSVVPPADGKSNFYNCGGPETTGCAGPLNHGCHCESLIASQSNWDTAKAIIHDRFGGSVYGTQGPNEVSGWQEMDRLWYLTRDIAVSGYSVTGFQPAGTTNGCGISNWFSTYRLVDDDDGDLSNGTPHSAHIFAGFALHETACGTVSDPSNQNSGCGALPAAPTLASCDVKSPVQLTFTASPGATGYRVLRNTLGCQYGFTPIGIVDAPQGFFEDADVAPGVPYYYSVQPIGSSPSCYGYTSNCIVVTPTTCAASPLPKPMGVTIGAPADNTIQVAWNTVVGAASYKVYRKDGACASTDAWAAIGVVAAPVTNYVDTAGILGGSTYAYYVVASDSSCASCTSPASACVSILATGTCTTSPSFGGVTGVSADTTGIGCRMLVTWSAANPACGTTSTYDVFRSTDRNFLPGLANRIATGVSGNSYVDDLVVGGTRYWYTVRARDSFGNTEANTKKVGETAVGTLTPGTFSDDAGDTGTAAFGPSPGTNSDWALRATGGGNARKVYATSASGPYGDNLCMGLESPTLRLGTNPTLAFRSTFQIEPGWDGGYVDVSTESGGFSNWSKLTTIAYGGAMAGPSGSPACVGDGFADGEPAFTGAQPVYTSYTGSLAAFSGQAVRLRFLFGSDPTTTPPMNGWLVDDISVSDVRLPGPCRAELSATASTLPLLLSKGTGGSIDFRFEDAGGTPVTYNVYQGTLGSWSSLATGECHDASSTEDGAGYRRRSAYGNATGPNHFFFVTSSNGTREDAITFDGAGTAWPYPATRCGP